MRQTTTFKFRAGVAALSILGMANAVAADDAVELRVNGDRLNATMTYLHRFGGTTGGGSARVAYSAANREALDYLATLMSEAGLTPSIDVAGNLVGRRAGQQSGLAPIVTGSHIDTVPNGGHYDGIVGVMSAIEVARTLHEAGHELAHPLEVVAWSNEEGGKTGSRSWAGTVASTELALPSLGERTIGEGIRYLGGDPERLADNRREPGSVASYVELHVEQGGVLDRERITIGVVEGIVGIRRWNVTVEGFANHAGTTPMDQRQDALYAAALIVADVRHQATAIAGSQVATVGRLQVAPGAPNVIPGTVVFSLEIRDLDMDKIGRVFSRIEASAKDIAAANGTTVEFAQFYESPAAITDERIKRLVQDAADRLGLPAKSLPSGAGHDAQSLKFIAPLGMIFIPSKDGISHAPAEFTRPGDIEAGANVLLLTLLGMDRMTNQPLVENRIFRPAARP